MLMVHANERIVRIDFLYCFGFLNALFLGDSIAAGRPSNWEQTRRPSFAGNCFEF